MLHLQGVIPDNEFQEYSNLKVLKSGAGYYLGTTYQGMPGSRDTKYFATELEAEQAMANYADIVTYMIKARQADERGDKEEFESLMKTCDGICEELGLRLTP